MPAVQFLILHQVDDPEVRPPPALLSFHLLLMMEAGGAAGRPRDHVPARHLLGLSHTTTAHSAGRSAVYPAIINGFGNARAPELTHESFHIRENILNMHARVQTHSQAGGHELRFVVNFALVTCVLLFVPSVFTQFMFPHLSSIYF